MDENYQGGANHNLVTTDDKIWLPPSYANNKKPVAPAPKKRGINWGFADRTVFDWTILVSQVLGAIAIPFVVTILGLYLTQQITQQQAQLSDTTNKQQHQTDLQIAADQQRETTLKTYLDDISDLLLNHNLSKSKPGDVVSEVARERTLTTLRRLNADRNRIILQFLQDAHLIGEHNAVIDLSGTNLSDVDLSGANLSGATLYGATLSGATLWEADLTEANLSGADLTEGAGWSGADLSRANLSRANLSGANLRGATMPDGSKHP